MGTGAIRRTGLPRQASRGSICPVADVMSDGPHEAAPLLTVAGAAQVGAHRWQARSLFPV